MSYVCAQLEAHLLPGLRSHALQPPFASLAYMYSYAAY